MAHIAYLSASTVPSTAANSVQVMRMCEALADAGHDVVLIAAAAPGSTGAGHDDFAFYGVEPTFEIVKIPRPRLRLLGQLLYTAGGWLAIARRARRTDVIYARDRLLALLAPAPRGALIFEAHDLPWGVRRLIEALLLRRRALRRVVLVSGALERLYRETFGARTGGLLLVAPNGHHDRRSPAQPLARGDRLAVGYAGHLYRGKAMEIIAPLARRLRDVADFHVVGGEATDVAAWRGHHALSGLEHVALRGPLPPAQVDAFNASMDVLLAPYQRRVRSRQGIDIARWFSPLKIVEAMAAGRALVASDLPPVRELVRDGHEALLVAPEDLDGWQRAIERLRDPALRQALGDGARRRFEAQLTLRQRVDRVLGGLSDTPVARGT